MNEQATPTYYAHTGNRSDGTDWQPLKEHLTSVAQLAQTHAQPFGAADWAHLVGLLHDLGKYSQAFQQRLHWHCSKTTTSNRTFGAVASNRCINPLVIRVQKMKHKRRSCSSIGTVTFATDLTDKEAVLQDDVIVHELLHLRYGSHRKVFKLLLTAHVPGWRSIDDGSEIKMR